MTKPDSAGVYHDSIHKGVGNGRAARTARNKPVIMVQHYRDGKPTCCWTFERSRNDGPCCHFCGVLSSTAELGVEHNGVEMCGKCIDEAREIARRG